MERKIKGLYEKRGWWYYQAPMVKGYRAKAIALGTQDRSEALRIFEQLRRRDSMELRAGNLRVEVARYLEDRLKGGFHTANTSRETARSLAKMIEAIGPAKSLDQVSREDLQAWQQTMNGLSAATVKSVMGRSSAFFAWAIDQGLILENPCRGIKLPRLIPTRAERYCTKAERDKLLAEVPAGRSDLALILWLGFFAGLRIGEIVEARVRWVDLDAGLITVENTETWTTKDKAHRRIRVSTRLATFLSEYLEQWETLPGARDRDFLLRPDKAPGKKVKTRAKQANRWRYDARRPFKRHVETCGLDWVSFHTLRHTFATLHALAGTPLTTIAREMGDDAETTFRNYVGYTRESGHSDNLD